MDNEKNKTDQDQAVIAKIQILVGKTKADSHPEDLEHLKKLIRKNVPFTLRKYFMAYLLRDALHGGMQTQQRRNPVPKQTARVQKDEATETTQAKQERTENRCPREQKRCT